MEVFQKGATFFHLYGTLQINIIDSIKSNEKQLTAMEFK